MKNVEIERKYLIKKDDLNFNYKKFKSEKIVQGFIYLKPAIRVRKANDKYYLTVKTKAAKKLNLIEDLARIEYEIEISKKAFNDLLKLCKGRIIYKTRYFIPYVSGKNKHVIELDVFEKDLKGLIYAEIEFKSPKNAINFTSPNWFFKDVTGIEKYKNTSLSICKNLKNVIK